MFRMFKEGVDDLVMVSSPSNAEITNQLGARFERELIYTNIGDVLIALNPYKNLPITGEEHIKMYQNSSGSDAPPHIYALAERAYRRLCDDKDSQCVIISGESGAGKTVSAKLILGYVTTVSPTASGGYADRPLPTPSGPPQRGPAPKAPAPRGGAPRGGGPSPRGGLPSPTAASAPSAPSIPKGRSTGTVDVAQIKKVILDSNPLMEAIGNAKTVRNDNSSRFGKYLEIQFDDGNAPIGGVISTFLLEKTRVAFQQKNERNFHIFYQILAGLDSGLKRDWGLDTASTSFFYLSQSGCATIDGVNDADDFRTVQNSMSTVGITPDEQKNIFRILAGCLHIGNVRFEGGTPATIVSSSRSALQKAAHILGVDENILGSCLNHRQIQTGSARGTQYAVPQNPDQSASLRDALAKTLYERVFDFIVGKINESMALNADRRVIGVLDIYGFEVFDHNSFEQFCINYVNERLQQIFIDLTVRGEQREYHDEGLPWKDIKFFDNKIVCDLIEASNPPGIMRVLDDTCRTVHALDSEASDAKFMEKMIQNFKSGHEHLEITKTDLGAREFTIKHYAGDVTYDAREFVFKNNDNLYASLVQTMQCSNVDFILSLFPENMSDNKQAPTTAGYKIRTSASYLVKRLSKCTPHYIRCIKPNDRKVPLDFVSARVEHQVKYLGLLENVKVKRAGYAYRHYKEVFLRRFGQLCETPPNSISDFVTWITRNVKQISNPQQEFVEGKTKIFVGNPETIFILEDLLMKRLDPEGYKQRVEAFKQHERLAKEKAGKHGLKSKCLVQ